MNGIFFVRPEKMRNEPLIQGDRSPEKSLLKLKAKTVIKREYTNIYFGKKGEQIFQKEKPLKYQRMRQKE